MAPRTVITPKQILAPFAAVSAGAADFVFAASTTTDMDEFICNGADIILAYNSNGGAQTITVHSVADEKNRTGNITTYSLAAGDYACVPVGLTNELGWQQTDRTVHIDTSHTDVKWAILRLPAGFGR